jgi:hypothetical protein
LVSACLCLVSAWFLLGSVGALWAPPGGGLAAAGPPWVGLGGLPLVAAEGRALRPTGANLMEFL